MSTKFLKINNELRFFSILVVLNAILYFYVPTTKLLSSFIVGFAFARILRILTKQKEGNCYEKAEFQHSVLLVTVGNQYKFNFYCTQPNHSFDGCNIQSLGGGL